MRNLVGVRWFLGVGLLLVLAGACEGGARPESYGRLSAALSAPAETLAAGTLVDASPAAPAYALDLSGAGAASGAPLAATVAIYLDDARTARLVVTNTSLASSSTEPGAPVLTRLGFNLADGPDPGCLDVAVDGGRFVLATRVQPLCGSGGDRFQYSLDARNPASKSGIARDESLTIVLTLRAACAGRFDRAMFADARETASAGVLTQWAAKFQVVGPGGEDSGCAQGVPVEEREPVYIWSEFIATAAEVQPLPSLYAASDTRAGSVELNYNGGYGFDGVTSDPAYAAGIATLRNGRGAIVEQWLLNRRWAPAQLDPDGCSLTTLYPQCWVWGDGGPAAATIPTWVADSNEGFDPESTQRVTVRAETAIEDDGAPEDNSAQWFRVTWEDPSGIATARMNLRLHFDANLDRTFVGDPFLPLYRVRFPGDGPDVTAPVVHVIAVTETSVTVEVNVQDAIDFVWDEYLGLPGYLP